MSPSMTRLAMFAVADVAGPLNVRIIDLGSGASFPRKVTDAPRRLFDFDECSDPMIQNLSASPIAIGIEAGLTFAQGFLIPARFVWSRFGLTQIDAVTIPGSPARTDNGYYDRNAQDIYASFRTDTGSNIGPHAETMRWSYTVPTGRRCVVEFAQVSIIVALPPRQQTPVATSGGARASIYVISSPNADRIGDITDLDGFQGVRSPLLEARLAGEGFNVGDRDDRVLSSPLFISGTGSQAPAPLIEARTENLSGVAAHQYMLIAKLVEFDA